MVVVSDARARRSSVEDTGPTWSASRPKDRPNVRFRCVSHRRSNLTSGGRQRGGGPKRARTAWARMDNCAQVEREIGEGAQHVRRLRSESRLSNMSWFEIQPFQSDLFSGGGSWNKTSYLAGRAFFFFTESQCAVPIDRPLNG